MESYATGFHGSNVGCFSYNDTPHKNRRNFGRTELIFGKSVGRYAGITAALILSCMGSLVAGLAGVAALIGGGFALDGALLAGLTLGLSGCSMT